MLPMRQLARYATRVAAVRPIRPMSSSAGPLVNVSDDEGIAVLTMQRAPVNSLNLDLLQAISQGLDDVANNKPKGLILTSASPTVFSAGLDIMEMYKPDMKRVEQFWTTLQDLWVKLFGFKFATAAAINGHAPAGGCLLAMSCEYRVMVGGKFTIGLNETALGMVAPTWFMDTMTHTISTRAAELALTTAKLFNVDEALKVGLIDEAASDKADAIDKCKKFIKKFDKISPSARSLTKQRLRQVPLKNLEKNRQADLAECLAALCNPQLQKGLEMAIQRLKTKA